MGLREIFYLIIGISGLIFFAFFLYMMVKSAVHSFKSSWYEFEWNGHKVKAYSFASDFALFPMRRKFRLFIDGECVFEKDRPCSGHYMETGPIEDKSTEGQTVECIWCALSSEGDIEKSSLANGIMNEFLSWLRKVFTEDLGFLFFVNGNLIYSSLRGTTALSHEKDSHK